MCCLSHGLHCAATQLLTAPAGGLICNACCERIATQVCMLRKRVHSLAKKRILYASHRQGYVGAGLYLAVLAHLQFNHLCVLEKGAGKSASGDHASSVLTQGVNVLNYVLCGSCHSVPTMEVWFHFKSMFVRAMPGAPSLSLYLCQSAMHQLTDAITCPSHINVRGMHCEPHDIGDAQAVCHAPVQTSCQRMHNSTCMWQPAGSREPSLVKAGLGKCESSSLSYMHGMICFVRTLLPNA